MKKLTKVIGNKVVPFVKTEGEIANENKMAHRETVKTPAERANLTTQQSAFKCNGLKEWNDRNRPGNNIKEA